MITTQIQRFTRIRGQAFAVALSAVVLSGVAGCTNAQAPNPTATQTAAQKASMSEIIIPIEGMSCSACAARVKKTLTAIDGVGDVEVLLAERGARIRYEPSKLSPARLVAAVNGLGYRATLPAAVK